MRIVVAGQPNSGKSTLFNSMCGIKVRTGNFPGTTVEYHISEIKYRGKKIEIVDLPGIYTLYAADVAEKVARDFLLEKNYDIIINVVDSSVLSRSLELTLELMELGKPMILCLNMIDEAEKKGLKINDKALEEILGIPVVRTIATRGIGIDKLFECLEHAKIPKKLNYHRSIEGAIAEIQKFCGDRLKAILYLEGVLDCPEVSEIRNKLEEYFGEKSYVIISHQRHALAMDIFEHCVKITKPKIDTRERIDRILFHPIVGYVVMTVTFALILFVAFYIGDLMSSIIIEPLEELVTFGDSYHEIILRGVWKGFVGGFGIVLPYLIPLLALLSFLEDIGYMSRIAYLLDSIFHRMGLHGKAVGSFMIGYGCTVPAILSNRIMEDEKSRIMIAFLVPLVPCSARSVIILAVIGGIFGAHIAILVYFINILIIFLLGIVISKVLKRENEGLIMEMPPLRLPTPKAISKKLYIILKEFVYYAFPVIIVSSAIFEIIEYAKIDSVLNDILSPFTSGILGLPAVLGITLIFGILRKELALYMSMSALGVHEPKEISNVLTSSQIFTFVLFVTFYMPCIASITTLRKEFGWKITLISLILSFSIATLVGLLIRTIFIFL